MPTSRAKTFNFSQAKRYEVRGFTIIEILIVLVIIAIVTAFAIPSISNIFRASAEGFSKQLALTLREARDRAMLTDKLIRLHIDLDQQKFWLEEAPSSYLLPKEVKEKSSSDKEAEEETSAFRLLTQLTKEKSPVPRGVKIVEVRSPRAKKNIIEGSVDIYFYNNGMADGATIYFETEENVKQSLIIHPVTGQSKIVQGFYEEERK